MRPLDWLKFHDIDDLDQRDGDLIDLAYRLFHVPIERYFRSEVRGVERIPEGAALYVGNHNALLMTPESFLFGFAVYRERGLQDVPFGLGHELALLLPGVNQLVVPMGAVRASHAHALELFRKGRKVLVYPGSEFEAMRSWRDRNRILFGGRQGYVRLALAAGVPIVPFVAAGAQETLVVLTDGEGIARALRMDVWLRLKRWPIALALPWGVLAAPLPFVPWPARILIEVLPPIRFDRQGSEAAADTDYVARCAARVEKEMQDCMDRLVAERCR